MKKLLLLLIALLPLTVFAAIELSVTTPTEREDNTPLGLSEIAGFNVYCGATLGNYTDKIYIAGATLPDTALTLDKPDGTHYCVATTVDIDGRESVYSEMVTLVVESKAIPKPPRIAPNQTIRTVNTLP